MESKATARIIPIGETSYRAPFYAASVQQVNKFIRGNTVKGSLFNISAELWKVEMLPSEWDGEGLPPIGTVCERSFNGTQWFLTTIVAHVTPSSKGHQAAFCDNDGDYNGWGYAGSFRPIRSARDKAIEALSLVILESHADDDEDMNTETYIYDAIAAGKIPGIKLED